MSAAGVRLELALAVGVAVLLGTALALLALHEPEGARGVAHATVTQMRSSGPAPGLALQLWGWLFGLAQIGFFVGLLALGARRSRQGLGGQARWLWLWGGVFALVWTALIVADLRYAAAPAGSWLWALPAPTIWMLLGVWLVPAVFIALYTLRFERFIYSDADRERFSALLREHGRAAGDRATTSADEGARES